MWDSIKLRLKTYLTPVVLAEAESPYNGKVKVVEFMGERRLMAGGYIQSGGFVEILWQRILSKLKKNHPHFHPQSAAIFGFAGGSAARCLKKSWPEINITAVDIDPVMIQLGRDYFHTDKLKSLTLYVEDVFSWIQTAKGNFNLILIDLFHGGKIPSKAASRQFARHLYRILAPGGFIAVNYFPHPINHTNLQSFESSVREHFTQVKIYHLLSEKIYLLEK